MTAKGYCGLGLSIFLIQGTSLLSSNAFFFSFVTTIAMKIDCIRPWPSLVILRGAFLMLGLSFWVIWVGVSEQGCFCWLSQFSNSVQSRTWSKTEGLWHTLKETLVSLSKSKWQLFAPWVVSFSSHSFSQIYQVLINVVCSALAGVLNHIINRYYSWLIRLNCLGCAIFFHIQNLTAFFKYFVLN